MVKVNLLEKFGNQQFAKDNIFTKAINFDFHFESKDKKDSSNDFPISLYLALMN